MTKTETDSDNTKIAVISKTLEYIQRDISAINTSMQGLAGVYQTKEEAIAIGKINDDRMLAFEKRIYKVESSRGLWNWLSPTLSAAAALIVGFLIENFLSHLR